MLLPAHETEDSTFQRMASIVCRSLVYPSLQQIQLIAIPALKLQGNLGNVVLASNNHSRIKQVGKDYLFIL